MPTGFDHPETRAHVRLLGPCFKTGRMEPYGRQHPRRVVCEHLAIDRQQFERTGVPSATVDMPNRSQESPARHASQSHGRRRAIRARGLTTGVEAGSPSSCPFRPSATDADARSPEVRSPRIASAHASSMRIESAHVAKREQLNLAGRIANSIRFPFNGFTYFLTLFSKSFSSFPHGTCSLSVSCLYLALDGVYHPFWAAFPNNPTLRKHIAGARALPRTGLSPSMTCCSKQLRHARCAGKVLLETTIRRCNTTEIFKLSCSLFIRHYWGNPC